MPFHLDYETASGCDIKLGSYRYANDPSTSILMFAIGEDDGDPVLWDFTDPDCDESRSAHSLFQRATESGEPVYAHNSQFELAISHYRAPVDLGLPAPRIDQWRCTLAMCRRAAAPESLAQAAEFFNLEVPKDPRGKALIRVFSILTTAIKLTHPDGTKTQCGSPVLLNPIPWDATIHYPGATGLTVREAWELFKEYCRQDVRVEQALHHKIRHFELRGPILDSFQFDMRMNFRGVPVNVEALRHAGQVVSEIQGKAAVEFESLCGLKPTQGKALLPWLRERGYPGENLQAGTVEAVMAAPPAALTPDARKVLELRTLTSFAALAKIPTMLAAVCDDGRVRGTVQWHAARTGRAGGRIIQPQNFKKSTIGEEAHLCYDMLRNGWETPWFEDLWSSPLEAIASSIRHFIQPPDGGFLDGDYVGVESRITPWLAGDSEKLQLVLDGIDLYKRIAVMVFNTEYDAVEKWQRTIAKPIELGCCFGVGARGLRESLANPPYNTHRSLKECKHYVKTYRDNHPETVQAWRDIEDAAKKAIHAPGKPFTACDGKLEFKCGAVAGIPYLTMRLPSGRRLYYPHPKVKQEFKKYDEEERIEEPWKREERGYWIDAISFYGKITGTSRWGRVHTWGSRLFENAVQSIGADLLNRGCVEAERRGFPVCMIVHDQALCEKHAASGGLDEFLAALCVKDDWAADFPLDADGSETPYYLKD